MSRNERFALVVISALAVVVRLVPVLRADGAVGDGGLFLSMIDDIRAGGLSIPDVTSYNQLDIPFLYPPGALLLAATIGEVSGATTLGLLQWMPFVASLLGVAAFGWFAFRVLASREALAALAVYAVMPTAYTWVIAGGGLTRSIGLLFALLACGVAVGPRASLRQAAVTGALLGASALVHPQTAVFGVIACLILTVNRPLRPWLGRAAVAAGVAIAVVSPWLIATAASHGLTAILMAGHRAEPFIGLLYMLNLRFSGAFYMDLFPVAAVAGVVAAIGRRQWRLLVLLVATSAAGPSGGDFIVAVVWSLLAGIGAIALLDLAVAAGTTMNRRAKTLAAYAGIGLIAFMLVEASFGSVYDRSSKLHSLTADQIAAMQWTASHAPDDARFVVPTNDVWGDDEVGEWFPALAERHAIGTVQGSEWLGSQFFREQEQRHVQILVCRYHTAACYRDLDPEAWVFIPTGSLGGLSPDDCCPALRSTLEASGYEIVYDEAGATIARPGG